MPSSPYFDLARVLAPFDAKTFLRDHWERDSLVVSREAPEYYRSLLNAGEVDRVVSSLGLHHPALSVVRSDRRVEASEYTFPSGLVDVARVTQQLADGGTLVFSQLDHLVPALAMLCRSMESELSTRFQTNVYYTPPNAQGFRTHYDSHDVFVLQCEGTKHWRLYDTPVELPFRAEEFVPERYTPGAVTREFVLEPGDMAYVPRGVMHDARTLDGHHSLHITLGVLPSSWAELVIEAVARVGTLDPRFRKALPPGFARGDFDRTEARAVFRELMNAAAEKADFDTALDHFVEDVVSTRHPLLAGSVLESSRWATLGPDDRVHLRPAVLTRVVEKAENVVLAVYGSMVSFPSAALAALRYALAHESFTARELPGPFDEAGKVALVRKLLREGVLTLRG